MISRFPAAARSCYSPNRRSRPGAGRRYGLRLVASERRRARPLLDQSQTLPVMGPDGKTFVAFLVQPQGCTPLRLSATVVGPHAGKAVVVIVPYACGE